MGGYWGPIPSGEVNDSLREILGEPEPVEVGVFPVMVKHRVVAFLVGDSPGTVVSETDRKNLADATQKAGLAFEVLILRKKILN